MTRPRIRFRLAQCVCAIAGVLGVVYCAYTANTDIANEPLSQVATGVRPNIMFILDNSGSMAWDYMPDYVTDTQPSNASTTAACFDSGDTTGPSNNRDGTAGSIADRPDGCIVGDPPYMSPDFNTQYYNPDIYYRPGANYDGSDKTLMNAANTATWTAVPTDAFGIQNSNQLGQNANSADLVNAYPDRAWCTATTDDPTGANCRVNATYSYPNAVYPYGRTSMGTVKYRFGGPYYYRMQTAQWCADTSLTASNCRSGSAVNPSVHIYPAGEFCTDPDLTDCAVGTALTPAHVYYGVRWCSDAGTLLTCQRKKIGNFRNPKHLGATTLPTVNAPARAATGTITVSSATSGEQITAITIDGVAVITGTITSGGSTTRTVATQIASAINSYTSSPDYTATVSGSTVTVTTTVLGASENGKAVVVTGPSTGTVGATATLTINSSGSNDPVNLTSVTVGTVQISSATCSGTYNNDVSAAAGTITAAKGTNGTNERPQVALAVRDCINAATATNGGYTATISNSNNNTVIVQAPLADGANANLRMLSATPTGGIPFTSSTFSGGQSSGILTSTTNMANGADATTAAQSVRIGVGLFSRTSIVATNNSYPKAGARVDCAGATCTYQEEMTNFANWYAYYRTRLQMMKSAAGRAFIPIDDTYRVGFITINPGSQASAISSSNPVTAAKYLKINTFDSTQKSAWYSKFYGQSATGGTPLREALSRIGRLYAGVFDGINSGIPSSDDPVQYSCQPNFSILSTDGYWNGTQGDTGGVQINGATMTQQDNVDIGPYSKRSDGVYDGGASTTVGLADTALYYYQMDLRTTGTVSGNNVPTTQKDFASHQHMTTFTLGLGLDGELSYRKDYETALTGDFFSIKQGTKNWPNPAADSPSALDDLWHAAVNGRGVFFSTKNPQELSTALSETLDALQKRVGAGAAAATSNLQPIAGDNFAFTAQYQTSDWIGDLKARTIDLSTGLVSSVELWSAQALLDAKDYTARVLYTFDPTDTTVNKLKSFCWPGTAGAACSDGTGLNATEQAYFNPNRLPQYSGWNSAQVSTATAQKVVDFLRGDTTYGDTGQVAATDLFRNRAARLGDIVNAQPAYVKTSPFNYVDPGYTDFKKCTAGVGTTCPAAQFPAPSLSRRATVFAAANDGMLHAFETDVNNNPYYQTAGIGTSQTSDDAFTGNNSGNGEERWAYIPSMVLPDLYKLASIPYVHRYFTDGTPVVGDICISTPCAGTSDWRTILVAGLNAGGRGYYALDITNPLAPIGLWEFKVRKPSVTACAGTTADAVGAADDCDLGLTYGNPVITKLAGGKWVVMVTSGYNNSGLEPGGTSRQGNGKGYLYVLDAVTGAILNKIGTGVGDGGTSGSSYTDADPSGLGRINNWVDSALIDNTTLAVYGGDLKGNLWRFDFDPSSSTYLSAVKVAELKTGTTPQPITVKPELGLVNNSRVIFLGTGEFLGVSDKTNTVQQTIYGIRDDVAGNTTVTGQSQLVQQTLTANGTTRNITSNQVDWTNSAIRGWYVDLPESGERVNIDPQYQLGTLVAPSNVPSTDACTAGGHSWINFLDKSGTFIPSNMGSIASVQLSSSLVVGINVVQLPGGVVKTIVTTADNQQLTQDTPVAPTSFSGNRVSWRELISDQ